MLLHKKNEKETRLIHNVKTFLLKMKPLSYIKNVLLAIVNVNNCLHSMVTNMVKFKEVCSCWIVLKLDGTSRNHKVKKKVFMWLWPPNLCIHVLAICYLQLTDTNVSRTAVIIVSRYMNKLKCCRVHLFL